MDVLKKREKLLCFLMLDERFPQQMLVGFHLRDCSTNTMNYAIRKYFQLAKKFLSKEL